MLIKAEKTELNQVSLTGIRSIILLGLLIQAPRSLEEIREMFVQFHIMEEEHSDDILRIDLNTLRAMGCDITRACAKTDYKYEIQNHPFALVINKEEMNLLKRVYKKLKESIGLQQLIILDSVFKKIATQVGEKSVREELRGLSALKDFDTEELLHMSEDCNCGAIYKLKYKTPTSRVDAEKEIVAENLVFKNDKVYLYGYDLNKQESIVLNVKRITSILSRKIGNKNISTQPIVVKFFLKSFSSLGLDSNESILEKTKDGFLIQGQYHNEFLATQRMLSFGSSCTVLEPQELVEHIIQKLKDTRKNYNE